MNLVGIELLSACSELAASMPPCIGRVGDPDSDRWSAMTPIPGIGAYTTYSIGAQRNCLPSNSKPNLSKAASRYCRLRTKTPTGTSFLHYARPGKIFFNSAFVLCCNLLCWKLYSRSRQLVFARSVLGYVGRLCWLLSCGFEGRLEPVFRSGQ